MHISHGTDESARRYSRARRSRALLVFSLSFAFAGGLAACGKLIDRTTFTPTNKSAQAPYLSPPELELKPFGKLGTGIGQTTYCRPGPDGAYEFAPQMTAGSIIPPDAAKFFFAEGGTCLDRGILDAWGASMNQPLMVWDDKGNSGTYQLLTPEKGVSRSFDVEYTHVEENMVMDHVKWSMTWHHTILAGTARRPDRVLINYRRYKGTKFIKYWEGTIILTRVTDRVTGVWIRNQIRASQVNEVQARGGANDILRKLREGEPARDLLP